MATGSQIEITTPPYLRMTPMIKTSQGQVTDYAALRSTVTADDIKPGTTATVDISLTSTAAAVSPVEVSPVVQVSFIYDQQITPQRLEIDISDLVSDAFTAEAGAGASFNLDGADAVSSPETQTTATKEGQLLASQDEAIVAEDGGANDANNATMDEATGAEVQSVDDTASLAESSDETTSTSDTGSENETIDTQTADAGEAPLEQVTVLPVTGDGGTSANLFLLLFATLIGVSMMIGGWRAAYRKR
jgi:hypothetical protein